MKNIFKSLLYILSLSIVVSCHDDLNQSPIDPDSFTEENVFASVNEAKGALALSLIHISEPTRPY